MFSCIFMRFPGGLKKAFTTSYDDGVEQDIRLIEIMRKNGIKGTFNLNSGLFAAEGTVYPAGQIHRRLTEKQCAGLYRGSDIEPAVHGYEHPFWSKLPAPCCVADVIDDRRALEKLFGIPVRGAAYPYGAFSDAVTDILDKCGITYCRTTVSTHAFTMPERPLTLHPTCHHDDPLLRELGERFVNENPERDPALFYLWGHAYEFEMHDNWNVIEDFLAEIGGKSDIWYATNGEIIDYANAFKKLVFSADGHIVTNPTCTTLWFNDGRETYAVGGGETIRI